MATAVPAIVTAGDRGAARAVYGESKVYLEVGGRPLVTHVVATLQRCDEISEVYVIGDSERLTSVFADPAFTAQLRKPLRVLEQLDNLYNNAWHGFSCSLPGAPPEGRQTQSEADLDHQVLYLSGDLPFITAEEISEFVGAAQASGCDYAIGMTRERSLSHFEPEPGGKGVDVTYFNLREARLKQTNLHLARPARIGNRHYIQDMYEHRKQREVSSMLGLAWRLLWEEQGGPSIVFFYSLIHIGGVLDRRGHRRLADWVRRSVSLGRVEQALTKLLKTRLRFIMTEIGGCALDVDTEEEYEAIQASYEAWRGANLEHARACAARLLEASSQDATDGAEARA